MPKASKSKPVEPSVLGLKRVRLLEGVPLSDLEQLAKQCHWARYAPGQNVIARAARDKDVYLIVSGRVRVTLFSTAGRQVTYRDIPAGDWFGDFAAIDGLSRSADVVALEESLVTAMNPERFCELLREHPLVSNRVMHRLVSSVRELTERVFELSTLGVRNRVHAELLRLARQAGVAANKARIDPAPTHEEIANRISTDRSEVTREMSKMGKQGIIQRAGRALVVPDISQLEQMVAEVGQSP
jgi:CRP/FNR family cyclic AMP-dependent transcriptional regulator